MVIHRYSAFVAALLAAPAVVAQIDRIDIEEIVVTARKQEESLLEVPVAVSVFDSTAIADLGLVRLEDVARFTPGFSFESDKGRQPSSYRPTIRGLTTIRNGIANTSAATTFIDGAPAPVVGRVSMDLLTVDVSGVQEAAAQPGKYAELIGDHFSADDLADVAGTIGYEVLTRLGQRHHRIYRGGDSV